LNGLAGRSITRRSSVFCSLIVQAKRPILMGCIDRFSVVEFTIGFLDCSQEQTKKPVEPALTRSAGQASEVYRWNLA